MNSRKKNKHKPAWTDFYSPCAPQSIGQSSRASYLFNMLQSNFWVRVDERMVRELGESAAYLFGKMVKYQRGFTKNDNDFFFRIFYAMEAELGWSRNKVSRTVKILEEAGLLEVQRCRGGLSFYRVKMRQNDAPHASEWIQFMRQNDDINNNIIVTKYKSPALTAGF